MPTATSGLTIGVPALSVFTHAMHEAYFGDVETEQTGRAYDVTLTCEAGLEADADAAGKTPSTANTPTHTISRRDHDPFLSRARRQPPQRAACQDHRRARPALP